VDKQRILDRIISKNDFIGSIHISSEIRENREFHLFFSEKTTETASEILSEIRSLCQSRDFPLWMFRAPCPPRSEIPDDEKRIPEESRTSLQAAACAPGTFLPPDNRAGQQESQCPSGMEVVEELVHSLLDLIRTGSCECNASDGQSEQLMQIVVQQPHGFLISGPDNITAESYDR
jgi:hypothetical protein